MPEKITARLSEREALRTGLPPVKVLEKETPVKDYEQLENKPSINGVTLEGNLSGEDLHLELRGGLPAGGEAGDLLMKKSGTDYSAEWITPADSAEKDNTRPITAAAVYTEIGNINALLATI